MIDQEMGVPVPVRLDRPQRPARPADMAQALAAIIVITRREWMSRCAASPAPDDAVVKRGRFAHPLIRFALDEKRSTAWRARIGRQTSMQNVVPLAELDQTPEVTR